MASKRTKGVQDARRELPRLLDAAHRGSRTVITKHGKPYAAIVPIDETARTRAGLTIVGLRGSAKKVWSRDAVDIVKALRKEWR